MKKLLSLLLAIIALQYLDASDQTESKCRATEVLENFREAYEEIVNDFGKQFLIKIGFSPVKYKQTTSCPKNKQFDFIVVGGGGAGAVVAARLAASFPLLTTLLIEAGGPPQVLTSVPTLTTLWSHTKLTWDKQDNVKQKNCGRGSENGRLSWITGKVLGGSSAINYMVADRGSPDDFNSLTDLGIEGWCYDEVLKYFKRLETVETKIQNKRRGKKGPITIEDHPYQTASSKLFVKSAVKAGYNYGNRNNGCNGTVSYVERMTKKGLREDTEKTFLRPVKCQKNLKILTNALVWKVIFEGKDRRAVGVKFFDSKTKAVCIARAKKEVILSAGSFGSPQILMLSGIGPHKDLAKFGIPCVKDLPVGKTLYEKLYFPGLSYSVNESITLKGGQFFCAESLVKLVKKGSGPLSSINGVEVQVMFKTPIQKKRKPDVPDIMIYFVGTGLNSETSLFKSYMKLKKKVYHQAYGRYEDKENVVTISILLVLPDSKGYLKLTSENPESPLEINGRFFKDPRDIERMIYGIREAQRIIKSGFFDAYGLKPLKLKLKDCQDCLYDSDKYWECALRYLTGIANDPVGTCRMGRHGDPDAVVDPSLRVQGVKCLRVIDSSVFPKPVSAFGSIPTIMAAEKGAYSIYKHWLNKPNGCC